MAHKISRTWQHAKLPKQDQTTFRSLAPMRKATIFAAHTITLSRDSARCFSICRELRYATSGVHSRQLPSEYLEVVITKR